MSGRLGDRSVSSVVGVVLIVALTIILAASVAFFAFAISDRNMTDSPQFSSVEITDVNASDGPITVPELDDGDTCAHYHLVITVSHNAGDDFTSDELEYFIEASGEDETVSGRFTSDDADPGLTASSGDEIIIALDGDTNYPDCVDETEESEVAIVFAGESAWPPEQPDEGDDIGNLHNTFFEEDTDDLEEVSVTIIQDSTDTVIIDDSTTDIRDHS
ncbi:type IV pilin [Natrarchaeobaculum sulfurireducens]|uniref:type IV pilin n=1 Tax=Natrarchaeobaculum sulfurireducens TaxID=2044521 RepID=UPI000E3B96E1|nr:type IV pilin [Natrarchaeobaculum sulfurireducens]